LRLLLVLLRETQRVPILCDSLEQDEVAADVYRCWVGPSPDEAVDRHGRTVLHCSVKPDPSRLASLQTVEDAREELAAL